LSRVPVDITDDAGWLLPGALPQVRFVKSARYLPTGLDLDADGEVEIVARIERNLTHEPLAGFVAEGAAGSGNMVRIMEAALVRAIFSGMPVAKVGRGNNDGVVPATQDGLFVGGSNLTANKARILLMASLMKLGSLPPARDPDAPTAKEIEAVKAKVREYQAIFDTH
jgi:hypothetical protein